MQSAFSKICVLVPILQWTMQHSPGTRLFPVLHTPSCCQATTYTRLSPDLQGSKTVAFGCCPGSWIVPGTWQSINPHVSCAYTNLFVKELTFVTGSHLVDGCQFLLFEFKNAVNGLLGHAVQQHDLPKLKNSGIELHS
jgi:hypothetical protein